MTRKPRNKYDGYSLLIAWEYLSTEDKRHLADIIRTHSQIDCHVGTLPLLSVTTALHALAQARNCEPYNYLARHLGIDMKAVHIRAVIKRVIRNDKRMQRVHK